MRSRRNGRTSSAGSTSGFGTSVTAWNRACASTDSASGPRGESAARAQRREKDLLVTPVSVEALAVDEECRCTVDPAAYATHEVSLHALVRRAPAECSFERIEIQPHLLREPFQVRGRKRALMFEQHVVHLPELALQRRRLREFRCRGGMRMRFSEREVAEYEAQTVTHPRLHAFDDGVG